jgi:hypothetical protein
MELRTVPCPDHAPTCDLNAVKDGVNCNCGVRASSIVSNANSQAYEFLNYVEALYDSGVPMTCDAAARWVARIRAADRACIAVENMKIVGVN